MQGNYSNQPSDTELERGLTMDASLSTTQIILIGALFGFLLVWMVTFAVLALRSNTSDSFKSGDLAHSSNSLPVNNASTMLHMIATQPIPVQRAASRQDTGEMEKVTIG
jgi:hypothetical protein